MNTKSKEINEQIEYGLDSIDSEKTIEIKLKDFMLIYKTFEELNRFFHQPMHYPTLEDIEIFLGNKEFGAYSIINKIYFQTLSQYLPKEIEDTLDDENNPLEKPGVPYYYKVKNDENIDDGTVNVTDRAAFSEYMKNLLIEYNRNGQTWEPKRIDDFIEGISRYSFSEKYSEM